MRTQEDDFASNYRTDRVFLPCQSITTNSIHQPFLQEHAATIGLLERMDTATLYQSMVPELKSDKAQSLCHKINLLDTELLASLEME